MTSAATWSRTSWSRSIKFSNNIDREHSWCPPGTRKLRHLPHLRGLDTADESPFPSTISRGVCKADWRTLLQMEHGQLTDFSWTLIAVALYELKPDISLILPVFNLLNFTRHFSQTPHGNRLLRSYSGKIVLRIASNSGVIVLCILALLLTRQTAHSLWRQSRCVNEDDMIGLCCIDCVITLQTSYWYCR